MSLSSARRMNPWPVRIGLTFACAALAVKARSADAPPRVAVPATDAAPLIDGALTEPLWQRPPDVAGFTRLGGGEPAQHPTEVWLARNEAWLFLAFRCREPAADRIACRASARDQALHEDDSVEVFLSPGTAGRTYFHFVVNAAGLQGDNRAEGAQFSLPWDGHWRSATSVDAPAGCWTVELAIPLFYLAADAGPDAWTLNLTRTRRVDAPPELSSWAPLQHTFHEPARFGRLDGLAGVRGEPVFAPVVQQAQVGPFMDIPFRGYEIRGGLRNDGRAAGSVEVSALDVPTAGDAARTPAESMSLPPGLTRQFTLRVPVSEFIARRASVVAEFRDALGHWLWTQPGAQSEAARLFVAAPDRSYYVAEPMAHVIYRTLLPEAELAACRVRIHWPAGERPDLVVVPRAVEDGIPVPIDTLSPGRYALRVSLEDAAGKVMAAEDCALIKRAPAAAGHEVQVDRWTGALLINGASLFPIGHVSFAGAEALPMMAELGATAVMQWGRFSDAGKLAALHEAAWRHGLFMVERTDGYITQTRIAPDPNPIGIYHPAWPEAVREGMQARLPGLVQALAPLPSLLAWNSLDEPAYEVHHDVLKELKQALETLDGRHPTLSVFCRNLPADWADGYDIGCLDIYLGVGADNEMRHFLGWLDGARQAARSIQKPLWVVLTSELYSGSPMLLRPSVQRAQTYLALIHEATGLFYFIWPLRHRDTHAEFGRLFAEVRALSPALLRRAPRQAWDREPDGDVNPVYARVFDHPDGDRILLAANAGTAPASVTWTFAPPAIPARVTDVFRPDAAYAVADGAFRDRLEGHGTRAYRLAGAGGPGEPLRIRLAVETTPSRGSNLVLDPQVRDESVWSGLSGDGPARHEPGTGRGGQGCLRLERAAGSDVTLRVTHVPIELKPNTRYRIAYWVRGEFVSGPFDGYAGPSVSVWSRTLNRSLAMCQSFYRLNQTPRDTREWEAVQGAFQTADEPETALLSVLAGPDKYVGTAWVSDVVLQALGPVAHSRNLLPNSGFEYATLPGYPDRWLSLTACRTPNDLTGNPGALLTQDDAVAQEGSFSLRLRGHHQLQTMPTRNDVSLDPEKTYTLSLFLKSDRDDQEVWLKLDGPNDWTKVRVGRDWSRAVATGTCSRAFRYLGVLLRTESARLSPEDPPTFWLDAAQVEEGSAPTDYTPDTYQR